MVTVPKIEQNVQGRGLPAGGYGTNLSASRLSVPDIEVNNKVGAAQQNLAQAVGNSAKVVNEVYDAHLQRGNQIALIDAQRKLDDWEAKNLYDANNGALAKKGRDAFNAPVTYVQEFDKFFDGESAALANDAQREKFKEMAYSRRNTIQKTLMSHERNEMDGYAKQQTGAAVESSLNRATLYYNNPDVVNSSIKSAQDIAESYGIMNGMPPEMISNQKAEIASKAHLGVLTRMADTNSKQAIDYYKQNLSQFGSQELLQAQRLIATVERKYKATNVAQKALATSMPITKSDEVINYVMNDLEGGDKVVPDGDGSIAKYGINSKHNPDVDVANLTPEQAAAIYKKRYYDPMEVDSLPADMRLVAYDAAVNHGVNKAKEMVKESNGDVRVLMSLRSKEYERLAKENPEKYGKNLEGWKNRLTNLDAQVATLRGAMPTEYEVASRIDSMTDDLDVAQDAKTLVKAQLKQIEDARKQRETEASDEAWQYVQGGREVPASIEARMSPKEINEMRKAQPDPEVYEQVRAQVVTGQDVNLADYRWRLGDKYDELVSMRDDPTKQANARKVDDVIKSNMEILVGNKEAKTPEGQMKLEQFRRAYDRKVEEMQKETGKPIKAADAQAIVDDLLLDVSVGYWGTSKKAYQLEKGEPYEVGGIPANQKFTVNGRRESYDAIVRNITGYLSKKGLPVNEDNIQKTYKKLVEDGKIGVSE